MQGKSVSAASGQSYFLHSNFSLSSSTFFHIALTLCPTIRVIKPFALRHRADSRALGFLWRHLQMVDDVRIIIWVAFPVGARQWTSLCLASFRGTEAAWQPLKPVHLLAHPLKDRQTGRQARRHLLFQPICIFEKQLRVMLKLDCPRGSWS